MARGRVYCVEGTDKKACDNWCDQLADYLYGEVILVPDYTSPCGLQIRALENSLKEKPPGQKQKEYAKLLNLYRINRREVNEMIYHLTDRGRNVVLNKYLMHGWIQNRLLFSMSGDLHLKDLARIDRGLIYPDYTFVVPPTSKDMNESKTYYDTLLAELFTEMITAKTCLPSNCHKMKLVDTPYTLDQIEYILTQDIPSPELQVI